MNSRVKILSAIAVLAVTGVSATMPAHAQSRKLLGSFKDWDAHVITEKGAKSCYMVSAVKKWTASREGVNRGDTYITVTHRPKFDVKDEVNVVVGYPIRDGSELRVTIDGKKRYDLFTQGRGGWAYDSRDDSAIVKSMKRGASLVARATSKRGTKTTDTYSLRGFTAAYNAISRACR